MKRNEGFTLIELLAVIVILAIIALIAMPSVINVIDKANKSAFKDSAYGLIKAGDLYYARQQMNSNVMEEDKVFEFPNGIEGLDFKGNKPIDGYMIINKEGQVQMAIHNGKYCITKGYKDGDVIITEDLENCFISIPITDLSFETRDIIIHRKDQILLTPIIEPSNATDKTLNWEIEDESIAIIEDGLLKAVSVGTTTLTVTTTDGTGISKKLNITIRDFILSDLATTGLFARVDGTNVIEIKEVDECAKNKTEGSCEFGTAFAIKVNDSETYKFYVLKDRGNEVTLIMDRNLYSSTDTNKGNVVWISPSDYTTANSEEGDNTSCSFPSCNDEGPLTALNVLKERTNGWTNIPAYTYILGSDDGGNRLLN